jgi:hypothetical protein
MFAIHVILSVSNPQLLLTSLLLFLVRKKRVVVAGNPSVANTAPVASVPVRDVANLSWLW